ncbi:glycerol kinase GlpK [Marinihelvus fidelis]|uniref:ATP:glycerol 3-phosphotransferase n=1 Tax=Marinihelvus fidelis TaxID=2613842 RepID=A0A5N0T7Z0_9GAMM|nr:glycerol kinase GlpK [Marinihelvus fidelis]KAA9131040.1 glycerol kinase GlpK [Marinihelvus fidelis]
MTRILAIDQSTSATKALLFDTDGRCLDKVSRDHRQHYPQPGWVEHDAEEIWQNTLAVSRELLDRNDGIAGELAGISITNQRETVVVFERGSGKPLCPAMVWQCRRGNDLCSMHEAAGAGGEVRARSGLYLDAYFSASKLQWLVRNRPELAAKLDSGEALVGTIDAYLVYRLTDGAVFATDSTNASRTLLYDINTRGWSETLCTLWQVPMKALPEVRESGAQFGATTLGGALPEPLPIAGIMGDSQAALFAHRCFQPGSAKATFGTGSSVMLNIGDQPLNPGNGVVTALAWELDGQPTYAFEGIIIHSASTLTWLRDQLGLLDNVDDVEALAGEIDDTGGVYLVPAFSGLGFPYWAPEARALITGLSGYSDRRHVARAALESMAYQLHDVLAAMQAESGVTLGRLHADGGPTANRMLMQFTADITRTELQVARAPDCSALGTALMGMLGLGIHSSPEELTASPPEDTVLTPSMSEAAARFRLDGWRQAVDQALKHSHQPSSS